MIMGIDDALAIIEDKLRNHRCTMRIDCTVVDGTEMDFNGYLREWRSEQHDIWAGVVAAGPTVKDVLCGLARAAKESDALSSIG